MIIMTKDLKTGAVELIKTKAITGAEKIVDQ